MITSTANTHVKYIRSLGNDRRQRHRERLFVLEGVRLVTDALASGTLPQLALYAPEQLAQTAAGQALLKQLVQLPNTYPATERAVAAAADTVNPQGVVAVVAFPAHHLPATNAVLVLDTIQDPGNVGTLLRSAEAAGFTQVLCTQGTADIYSPKVVRAAMGAHFALSVLVDQPWEQIAAHITRVQAIYAAVGTAQQPYDAVDWTTTLALIIGNEAQGVSPAGRALATHEIAIPMVGRAESLNAAVAGSVIMFEALRQRRHTIRQEHN